MSAAGPFGPSVTGLFRSAWRPRKSVVVLWRRVETISPDAYAAIMDWVQRQPDDTVPSRWLAAMATNEVALNAGEALVELDALLQRQPPAAVREQIELLRDLIWEASEPTSDWLAWRPCRLCGRRWAVAEYEGVPLCPRHRNPASLRHYRQEEGARFPGLTHHEGQAAAARAESSAAPEPNGEVAPAFSPAPAEPPASDASEHG